MMSLCVKCEEAERIKEEMRQPNWNGLHRRFRLRRLHDVTGVSGEGIVAEGVQFSDNRVAMRWCVGSARSTVLWDSITEAVMVHGHDGNTIVEWVD